MFGEQILLSIRYGAWSDVNEPVQAANWARFWRPEIQGYIHAYRAVTGVDLDGRDRGRASRRDDAVGAAAQAPGGTAQPASVRAGDARLHVGALSRTAAPERVAPSLGGAHPRPAGRLA